MIISTNIPMGCRFPIVGTRAEPPDMFSKKVEELVTLMINDAAKDTDIRGVPIFATKEMYLSSKKGVVIHQGNHWQTLRTLLCDAFREIANERIRLVKLAQETMREASFVYGQNWATQVDICMAEEISFFGMVRVCERGGVVPVSLLTGLDAMIYRQEADAASSIGIPQPTIIIGAGE